VYEVFSRYANGTTPTAAITGQTWGWFNSRPYVNGGQLDAIEGSGASYLELNAGTNYTIDGVGASFVFDDKNGTRTGNGGTATLVTWADGGIVANGFGRRTRLHFVVTPTGMSYFVRDSTVAGTAVTNIYSFTFPVQLAKNTVHRADISISGTTATMNINSGQYIKTVTDARIAARAGETFFCVENYYTTDGTDARVQFQKTWATTTALPVNTAISAGTAVTRRRASTTSTESITLPALTAGQILVLNVASAIGAVTPQPTYTIGGPLTWVNQDIGGIPQNRASATSSIFTYKVTSSDAATYGTTGPTITVAQATGTATLFSVVVIPLNNLTSFASLSVQNAGSTSPITLSTPAVTPAAGIVAMSILDVFKSTPAASTYTPPTGYTSIATLDPTSSIQVGIEMAWNPAPNSTVGTTWVDSVPNSHYYTATTLLFNV